jgi:hypothetical protein
MYVKNRAFVIIIILFLFTIWILILTQSQFYNSSGCNKIQEFSDRPVWSTKA